MDHAILRRASIALVLVALVHTSAHAQFFSQQAVGGVSISTDGVLSSPSPAHIKELREYNVKHFGNSPKDLTAPAEMRMVSLRAISESLASAKGTKFEDLPAEIQFLGGIQRLQFIFVYPEQHDIVLAGPGEGWKVDGQGNIVGETTNHPVLLLHDLMVAIQTSEAARQGGVSCSIDPTAEGRRQLDAFLAKQTVMNDGVVPGVEQALGRQTIALNGVPTTSHFARTLVASDYQMKRLAMQLEESPLATLPSFLRLLTKSNSRVTNMMPRWWLACNYEPLGRGADGLSWEIRGPGVKVMTEDELIGEDGTVQQTGKADPIAQKWADSMTEQYQKLAEKKPVFFELRNVMDLAVAAAIIAKEDLAGKAGLDLAPLSDTSSELKPEEYQTPKFIDSKCTLMKRGKEWVITASGGVDVNSWEVASKTVDDAKLDAVRSKANPPAEKRLTWDAK